MDKSETLVLPADGLSLPDALDYFVTVRVGTLMTDTTRLHGAVAYNQAQQDLTEAQEQFRLALPPDLKSQWIHLDDAEANLDGMMAEAMYRLGLQDGLRMGFGGLTTDALRNTD